MTRMMTPRQPQETLSQLLRFLGIEASKCADLTMTVERSPRWEMLNAIGPDDPRYESAQTELAVMPDSDAWMRRLDWCELTQVHDTIIRIERRAFIRVLPAHASAVPSW